MSPRRPVSTMAAVLMAAAMLLTAGCSSGDDGGYAKKKQAKTASAPPAADGREKDSKAPEEKDGKEDSKGAKAPKVPAAELSPATGTFTKKQKRYLVNRVPEGTDPVAVLEAGEAACDRIKYTAEADRKAAVSALKTGEIPHAEAAVEHLCPKYAPLLEAAGIKD